MRAVRTGDCDDERRSEWTQETRKSEVVLWAWAIGRAWSKHGEFHPRPRIAGGDAERRKEGNSDRCGLKWRRRDS